MSQKHAKPRPDHPVMVELPVQWGDMDAFGHVNNTVYLRWFETARISYFRRIGFATSPENARVAPILASTACRYRFPVTWPDTVIASASVSQMEQDRFTMDYAVYSTEHEDVAATGHGVVVTFDYGQREKMAIPQDLRDAIAQLES